MDRRRFLSQALGIAVGGAVWSACGGSKQLLSTGDTVASLANNTLVIPDVPVAAAGEIAPFITPQSKFFRIDTAIGSTPQLAAADWELRIHGLVNKEVTLKMADIAALPQVENVITLGCVSNEIGGDLIGNARWGGVLLADLLKLAGVQKEATQLASTSSDGWTCGTPVDAVLDGRPAMLATSMNGEPLTAEHGFPIRMIVPGLFGYVSATKWVTDIELTTWDAFQPYWLKRGWSAEGPMLASSRIDTPRNGDEVVAGSVPIGGLAWAPRAGVAKVEVQIDEEPWRMAEVVPGGTGDTWVQWRTKWNAQVGKHRIAVRVTDTKGVVQDEEVRPVAPSGATGYHVINVTAV